MYSYHRLLHSWRSLWFLCKIERWVQKISLGGRVETISIFLAWKKSLHPLFIVLKIRGQVRSCISIFLIVVQESLHLRPKNSCARKFKKKKLWHCLLGVKKSCYPVKSRVEKILDMKMKMQMKKISFCKEIVFVRRNVQRLDPQSLLSSNYTNCLAIV